MRRILTIVLVLLGVATVHGQTTPGVIVTGKLVDGQGNVLKNGYLHFELYNCGANVPQVVGAPNAIVQQQFDMRPNPSTGLISGAIYGQDQILCGNVQSTQWAVTLYKATGQVGIPTQYYCLTSSSAFDPSTTQPCSVTPPPPGFISLLGNPLQNQTW